MKENTKPKKVPDRRAVFIICWLTLIALILAAIFAIGLPDPDEKSESIKELMRDGVLHEHDKVLLFGRIAVNPALISAYVVSAILLVGALIIRIFVIPRFDKYHPKKFQSLLETVIEFFLNMAEGNSPHSSGFVGAYIFSAGVYIFFSTIFELFGLGVTTASGGYASLPAPLADINGALAMGILSFLIILGAGLIKGGFFGMLGALKDFSLPISMSFRLFGALLSGLLVTELVYYYSALSFVLPVAVGVMFTLLHAIIQTFVLATLVSTFYGEAAESEVKKIARAKKRAEKKKHRGK